MPWKTPNAVSTEIARTAVGHRAPGHIPALAGDDVHVLAVGADVARGDVAPAQRLDEAAVRAEQRFGLERGRIADDHGLTAAVVQARQRVLVGHRAGQVEHVRQGRVLVRIGVEAGPAECGAECGRVDRDDRAQATLPVLAENDLLVPGVGTGGEGGGRRGNTFVTVVTPFAFWWVRVAWLNSRSASLGWGRPGTDNIAAADQ